MRKILPKMLMCLVFVVYSVNVQSQLNGDELCQKYVENKETTERYDVYRNGALINAETLEEYALKCDKPDLDEQIAQTRHFVSSFEQLIEACKNDRANINVYKNDFYESMRGATYSVSRDFMGKDKKSLKRRGKDISKYRKLEDLKEMNIYMLKPEFMECSQLKKKN